MSDRASSRHRAPQRAATPLSDVSEALTGQLATVGRSGLIVAMSTGLVAGASMPAEAVAGPGARAAEAASPLAAPLTTGRSSVLLGSVNQAHRVSTSASAVATVSFESEAFTAVPAPTRKAVKSSRATSRTAAPSRTSTGSRGASAATAASVSGSSVLAIAARYVGTPYLYGGTTPRGFDCSGFTGYVYRQLGISLPRTANQQMLATQRISRSQARPGDLVFFVSAGRAYHNGIYAGNGMMYDSPRSGKTLQKREIWSSSVVFTRVS